MSEVCCVLCVVCLKFVVSFMFCVRGVLCPLCCVFKVCCVIYVLCQCNEWHSFHARVGRFSPFLYLRSVAIAVILFWLRTSWLGVKH